MKPNLKILLVSEYFPPDVKGGGELSAELIAKNLVAAGHEVHVLTTVTSKAYKLPGAMLHRTLHTRDYLSISGNIKRMLCLPRQVRRDVRRLDSEHHFDIIHYLNAVSILGSLKKQGQVATINSYVTLCPKGNRYYKEREACSGCSFLKYVGCLAHSDYLGITRIPWWLRLNPPFMLLPYLNYLRFQAALKRVRPIAASTFVAEQLTALGLKDIVVIPHFPAEPQAQKRTPKKRGAKLQILFVGSLERQKGVEMLLEAYALLPKALRGNAMLRIVGDGSLRAEIKKVAPEGVEFLGKVEHEKVIGLIRGCDLMVIPSALPEPLSRVLLEAVSLGTPVLATAVGGNTDVIVEGIGGYLVPQDVEALSIRLGELMQKPDGLAEVGRKGQERYRREFSADKILAKLESFYRGLIE